MIWGAINCSNQLSPLKCRQPKNDHSPWFCVCRLRFWQKIFRFVQNPNKTFNLAQNHWIWSNLPLTWRQQWAGVKLVIGQESWSRNQNWIWKIIQSTKNYVITNWTNCYSKCILKNNSKCKDNANTVKSNRQSQQSTASIVFDFSHHAWCTAFFNVRKAANFIINYSPLPIHPNATSLL